MWPPRFLLQKNAWKKNTARNHRTIAKFRDHPLWIQAGPRCLKRPLPRDRATKGKSLECRTRIGKLDLWRQIIHILEWHFPWNNFPYPFKATPMTSWTPPFLDDLYITNTTSEIENYSTARSTEIEFSLNIGKIWLTVAPLVPEDVWVFNKGNQGFGGGNGYNWSNFLVFQRPEHEMGSYGVLLLFPIPGSS